MHIKNLQISKVAEWLGSITGLAGAGLLALNSDISGYGFWLFLLSNIAWLTFGVRTRTWSLVLMQVGFAATSVVGINNWLLG